MKRQDRVLFGLLFGLPLLLLTPFALVGSSVFNPGVIQCQVVDKTGEGCNVGVVVPAGLATVALHAMPHVEIDGMSIVDEIHGDMGEHAVYALDLARTFMDELQSAPDCMLVEVISGQDIVRIEKVNGAIEVNVDTPRERVHVVMPMHVVQTALAVI